MITTPRVAVRWPIAKQRGVHRVPAIIAILMLVPIGVEVVWVFWPAGNSFWLSMTEWTGAGTPTFVGTRNYESMIDDTVFHQALSNTLIWLVAFGLPSVGVGLALALALNRPRRGVGLYRTAIYLPMVFSLAVTGVFWRVLYQPGGATDALLGFIGLDSLIRLWLADPNTALYAVMIAAIWRHVGLVMVLYLAGLKACDPILDDAARVDGAGGWQLFRFVTKPQLRGVSSVVFAVTVIESLRAFDIVWVMTRGGPYHASEVLTTYMYQQAFTFLNLGYGSALAVIIFLAAIAFIITYLVRAGRQGVI